MSRTHIARWALLFAFVILLIVPASAEDTHTHDFADPVPFSAVQHLSVCTTCGEEKYEDHTFGEWMTVREPTEKDLGLRTCTCTACAAVRSEMIAPLTPFTEGHEHIFGGWIQYSAFQHYCVCPCGAIEFGDHDSPGDLLIDVEPTSASHGIGHRKCSLCMGTYDCVFVPVVAQAPSVDTAESQFTNPFTDVSDSDAHYNAVAYVVSHGIFNGVSPTLFDPASPMTRGMFVTVLSRAAGADTAKYDRSAFSDVQIGIWYGPAVQWAVETKIVQGYEDGTFRPDDAVTVEQALVILRRYAEYLGLSTASEFPLTSFTDADTVSDWALASVCWAVERNLYDGSDGMIVPQSSATRALVAEMLYRFDKRYSVR